MADILDFDKFRNKKDGNEDNDLVISSGFDNSLQLEGYEEFFKNLSPKEMKIGKKSIELLNLLTHLSRACMQELRMLFGENYEAILESNNQVDLKTLTSEVRKWDVIATEMSRAITLMSNDEYMKNYGRLFGDFHMLEVLKRQKKSDRKLANEKIREKIELVMKEYDTSFLEKYRLDKSIFENFLFVLNLLEKEI